MLLHFHIYFSNYFQLFFKKKVKIFQNRKWFAHLAFVQGHPTSHYPRIYPATDPPQAFAHGSKLKFQNLISSKNDLTTGVLTKDDLIKGTCCNVYFLKNLLKIAQSIHFV